MAINAKNIPGLKIPEGTDVPSRKTIADGYTSIDDWAGGFPQTTAPITWVPTVNEGINLNIIDATYTRQGNQMDIMVYGTMTKTTAAVGSEQLKMTGIPFKTESRRSLNWSYGGMGGKMNANILISGWEIFFPLALNSDYLLVSSLGLDTEYSFIFSGTVPISAGQ